MNFNRLIERVRNILLAPNTEWPVIAAESSTTSQMYTNYILILAAIPALAGFIKGSILGFGMPFVGTVRLGFGTGITQMLLQYGLALGLVFVMALIIDALAPSFGGQKNQGQALKTAAYTYTAGWVAGIAVVLPWIGWLLATAGSIYGIYLLYLGLPHTMKAQPERSVAYTAVVILIGFVLSLVVGTVVAVVSGAGAALSGGGIRTSASEIKFDEDSALGKWTEFGAKMEAAGKQMEAAQKSGDVDAQAAAAAAIVGNAFGSGGKVEALAPSVLKGFVPETLDGLPRTRFSAEKNRAMGMQVSTASADYGDGEGRRLRLEITDTGSAKGLMGMAAWAAIGQESETDTGYEKTYNSDGRLIHEKWNRESSRGEYSITLGKRFLVKVEGKADSVEHLKGAVGSIDLAGLEALKGEGVEGN